MKAPWLFLTGEVEKVLRFPAVVVDSSQARRPVRVHFSRKVDA